MFACASGGTTAYCLLVKKKISITLPIPVSPEETKTGNFICREKQIASIQATFVAAQLPPMHASKPHLRPELVLPLLPDADRFDDPFVQAVFDAEPTAESERHRHYAADVREEMAARVRFRTFFNNLLA